MATPHEFIHQRLRLTPREKEVMLWVIREYSSEEIAKLLGIRLKTVQTFRRSIIRKTQRRHVAGWVKYAIQQGWMPGYSFQDTSHNS